MKHVDYYARLIFQQVENPKVIVDATAGNGHDTLRLCKQFPSSTVYAFDVQRLALEKTQSRLEEQGLENAILIQDNHANLQAHIQNPIDLLIFNLGYLPGSDKACHTHAKDTVSALEAGLELLRAGGLVLVTAYPGSIRGKIEQIQLKSWLQSLDQKTFDVSEIAMLNQKNEPPILYVIHKK